VNSTSSKKPTTATTDKDAVRDHTQSVLTAGLVTVRAEMLRVDSKANTLLGIAGVLLAIAITVMGGGKVSGLAAVAGWVSVVLIGAAVLPLAAAIRPKLDRQFGFVHWARQENAEQLLECMSRIAASDPLREQARELRWLSVALVRKFRNIRLAVNLMVVGLAVAAIAAVIARA
jgi:hypothetical protein